jgi:IS5 family transposase
VAVVAPQYPAPTRGRGVMPLERMLRIYFCQQWFNLSDPAMEDALYDIEPIRRFAGLELGEDAVPDETTILRFRHLLEAHGLTEALFETVNGLLEEKGLLVKRGTIVDATILHAPSSTKNTAKTRDPEMRSTRKGNQWYFGMKVHTGSTLRGLVHSIHTTDAAAADIDQLPVLLSGEETVLYGDKAYWSEGHRAMLEAEVGIRFRVNRRGTTTRPLTARDHAVNRARSRRRAWGEHAYHTVKALWGFRKVPYRGLRKNTVRVYAAFMLANLFRVRKRVRPGWAT